MPDQQRTEGALNDSGEKYLLAEYQALIDIDSSRNERLDRLLTTFVTLAAAPWALYVLVLRENLTMFSFSTMPSPIAVVFILTGIIGFVVAMMFVQMRFTVILYTRAMNAIRGYFAEGSNIQPALRLPTRTTVPPYYEKGSYIQLTLAGMALVDSGYIGLGLYQLISWKACPVPVIFLSILVGVIAWFGHMGYYLLQARARERRDPGTGELRWG
jgi:hypothetical protein